MFAFRFCAKADNALPQGESRSIAININESMAEY